MPRVKRDGPSAYGLPEKFSEWRVGQGEAFEEALQSEKRWVGLNLPTGCGKTSLYVALAAANEWRTLILTATRGLQSQLLDDFGEMGLVDVRGMCVAPETRVLTADLRWIPAAEVRVGERLAAFDEQGGSKGSRRKWQIGEVISTRALTQPRYRLVLASGATVVCSDAHRWLIKSHHSGTGNDIWLQTKNLKIGTPIKRVLYPWAVPDDRNAGWLAGALDGEGSLYQRRWRDKKTGRDRGQLQLGFVQRIQSTMLGEFKERLQILEKCLGIEIGRPCVRRVFENHEKYSAAEILTYTSQQAVLTLLGSVRPQRLLAKLDWQKLGSLTGSGDPVMEKVECGDGPVIALTTTVGTFIAEGLASHNSNYPCKLSQSLARMAGGKPHNCDEGVCLVGQDCRHHPHDLIHYSSSPCHYYDAVDIAAGAGLVVTNYAFYFHDRNDKLGAFDCVVMDEAHEIPELLAAHVAIKLTDWEIEGMLGTRAPADPELPEAWQEWASQVKIVDSGDGSVKEQLKRQKLREKLDRLAHLRHDWLVAKIERGRDKGWSFEPIWPTAYAPKHLWRSAPKILLSSATMRPQTLEHLGLGEDDYDWVEAGSPFPVERRPVLVIDGIGPAGTPIRVQHNMPQSDREWWLRAIDKQIDKRLDRKGIIHTISYQRAKWIKERSRHRERMLMHDSFTTRSTVAEFKDAAPPVILLSPSVTTGWDFPADLARYQIVAKVPFPDATGAVMKARTKLDRAYPLYMAMTTLVQMAGRIVRSEEDWGETIIMDDHASWFIPRCRRYAPRWFLESVQAVGSDHPPLNFPIR